MHQIPPQEGHVAALRPTNAGCRSPAAARSATLCCGFGGQQLSSKGQGLSAVGQSLSTGAQHVTVGGLDTPCPPIQSAAVLFV